jgi:two-component system CheB/CheR fusion protein
MKRQPYIHGLKTENDEVELSMYGKSLFPVVGIGASAGGLEALGIFLKHLPDPCGLACVIVQHLDPARKGMMVELLQKFTLLPVVQITDNLKIEPDHIYVIPPNYTLSIQKGILYLSAMDKSGWRRRLPIDLFFRSMADDLGEGAIGVILSGMGSDGTLGLRSIKEKGGKVFVQDPLSSKFDGMPRSAVEAELADIIAPVEDLPAMIMDYLKQRSVMLTRQFSAEEKSLSSLQKVLILLRSHSGHDFSHYKKNAIYHRIERRMGIHQIEKITDYVTFLQNNSSEIDLLFKELLIGVTSFFRDPDAWDVLKTKAIPSIFATLPSGGILRAWVAGCSTGEEAYSLAILFREVIESLKPAVHFKLQIFATDLDKDAIDIARCGIYPLSIASCVSSQRLQRYFEKDDRGFRISRSIRESIVFAPHNVIMDPPFTKLDILVCRNLLIYMEQELQQKVLPLFHYSLNLGGILFLGSAESLGVNSNLFEAFDSKTRLFRKLYSRFRPDSLEFSAAIVPDVLPARPIIRVSELNLQSVTEQLLLQHYTPAAVLTNETGDIIYISGRTGKYLEPSAGKANWNIFAMAREGLRYELNLLFGEVLRQKGSVTKKGLTVGIDGGSQMVDLTVSRLEKPELLRDFVLVVFTDVALTTPHYQVSGMVPADRDDITNQRLLELELMQAKDEILAIRAEMQDSREELKSANEEMQSANEELQSNNEELTTSREEMQSANEEMQAVNHELESKVSELLLATNDMKNLLNSTDIATLFLDDSLNIRRFTTRTSTIIKLIAGDIGRPVTDIVTDLCYPDLANDALKVLRTLVVCEKQIYATADRWFIVKIMPYRTQENRIDGVVITFTDISVAKKYEQGLKESEERFRFLFEAMPGGAFLQDSDGKILMVNHEAERILGFSRDEMHDKTTADLLWRPVRADGSPSPHHEDPAHIALQTGKKVSGFVMGFIHSQDHDWHWIKVTAQPRFLTGSTSPCQVVTTFTEISLPEPAGNMAF